MYRKCPNNNKHWIWNTTCTCTKHNPFYYYKGKWNINPQKHFPTNPFLSRSGLEVFDWKFVLQLITFIMCAVLLIYLITTGGANYLFLQKSK